MPVLARSKFMTEEHFLSIPVSREHLELVDGEVILSPSPTVFHQELIHRLSRILDRWADRHPKAWVGLAPLDVRLAPGRIVQPDLLLILSGRPRGPRVNGAPDLVIEVLSSNELYDVTTKRKLYAEAGVPEYWIVDAETKTVQLVCGLKTVEVCRTMLRSRIARGLKIDVKKLFLD